MYSREDQVTLSGEGDVKPEKLTSTVDSSNTEDMTVTAVGIFTSLRMFQSVVPTIAILR